MRIYGIDFTSSPSKRKGLYLAVCTLTGDTLAIERLVPLNAVRKEAGFDPFREWLHGAGEWAEPGAWVAGLDFPFGMPVEAVERFGWLDARAVTQTWADYVGHIKATYDKQSFRECIEGWRHPTRKNSKGEPVRIRRQRLVDKLAKSGSPMNYFPPPVCPMSFEGARLLLDAPAGVGIAPVRPADSTRIVVETYPRLVANVFIGRQRGYKDKAKWKEVIRRDEEQKMLARQEIVDGIADERRKGKMRVRYGFSVYFPEPNDSTLSLRDECIKDLDGDMIDSVLWAVQAAWAYRDDAHGMPHCTVHALRDQVRLEGWIADPELRDRLTTGES